jgi:hypothetical protein
LRGPFFFNVADRQLQQFADSGIVGEVAAVLDDLAELVVQRLDRVGGVDDPSQLRRKRQERYESLPHTVESHCSTRIVAPSSESRNASHSRRAASASTAVSVRIFDGDEVAATHVLHLGGRSTKFEHYPPHKVAYTLQAVIWCRYQANEIGPGAVTVV